MITWLHAFRQTTTYLGILVVLAIWGGIYLLASQERARADQDALRKGQNLVRVLDEYISRIVRGSNSALLALRHAYGQNPNAFDLKRWADTTRAHNEINIEYAIVGADGLLKHTSLGPVRASVSYAGRGYFKNLAQSMNDELAIGEQRPGPLPSQPVIELARRLAGPDDAFDGVVVTAIDVEQLEKFFSALDLGPAGIVSLAGFDGIIRARGGPDPTVQRLVGASIAKTQAFRQFGASPRGSYWNDNLQPGRLDGINRLVTYSVVSGEPLLAIVGLAEGDVFAQSNATVLTYIVAGIILTILVLIAVAIGAAQQAHLQRTAQALERTHARLLEVTEAVTAGVILFDQADRLVLRNRRCEEMYEGINYLRRTGATFEENLRYALERGALLDAVGREDEWIAERFATRARQGTHEHLLANGRWVRYDDRRMSDGGFIATIVDITELKHREEELKLQNSRFIATIENVAHGLCMFDKDLRLIVCNARYSEMYGLSRDHTQPGTALQSILEARVAVGNAPQDSDDYVKRRLEEARSRKPSYLVNHMRDGRIISISHQPMADGGCVAIHHDITAEKRAEMQIAYMARHDGLTGLANRMVLSEKMEEALARLRRYGEGFAVVMLDLDLFKTINDSLGHPVGDGVLKVVAERLSSCTRETDTVARLGGDEFAILTTANIDRWEVAIVTANRLLKAVAVPFEFEGHHIDIAASIGIALAPEHGEAVEVLMKSADLALYKAKSEGRNTFRFFETAMGVAVSARHALQSDLRNALANEEFALDYQPIVEIESGEITGVEALVRWRHPQRGLVAPSDFIPLAEESGLINAIGEWVLRRACADAVRWPPHVKVSVNLSPVQLRNASPIDLFCRVLGESSLPPERLELEVTESAILHSSKENLETLHQLQLMGVSVVLDDFGTGYSSLTHLRLFPFGKIKIDRSFVRELENNAESTAIVSAMASLGHGLSIGTVAEGVETEDQLVLVRAAGCTHAQGYLFGLPCPVADLEFRRTRRGKEKIAAA